MLALTRCEDEQIIIHRDGVVIAEINVVHLYRDYLTGRLKVRLAFESPREYSVDRLEVYNSKMAEAQNGKEAGRQTSSEYSVEDRRRANSGS